MALASVQASRSMEITALSPHTGVRLTGLDLETEARQPQFLELLRKLLRDHLVVFIPQQQITGATMEFLPAQLGPLVNIKRAVGKACVEPVNLQFERSEFGFQTVNFCMLLVGHFRLPPYYDHYLHGL